MDTESRQYLETMARTVGLSGGASFDEILRATTDLKMEVRKEREALAGAVGLSGGATSDEILHAVKELKAFHDAVVGFVTFAKGGR